MNCLEILVKFSIISNMGTLFFTSRTMIRLFIGVAELKKDGTVQTDAQGNIVYRQDKGLGVGPFFTNWTKLQFAIFILSVEHVLIIMQMFIGIIVDDTPDFVIHGEREQKTLQDNFKKKVANHGRDGEDHGHEEALDAEEIRAKISEALSIALYDGDNDNTRLHGKFRGSNTGTPDYSGDDPIPPKPDLRKKKGDASAAGGSQNAYRAKLQAIRAKAANQRSNKFVPNKSFLANPDDNPPDDRRTLLPAISPEKSVKPFEEEIEL